MTVSPAVVAVIPARGGSKGVPAKNLATVGGVPLVARAVRALVTADRVDVVIVSTDSDDIAAAAAAAGAVVVRRPSELSGDTATSESAVLHALDETGLEPETVVLVQCTSPFIAPETVDAVVAKVRDDDYDVAFTAVRVHEFLWRVAGGTAAGVNHDPAYRPRRQDRDPEYRETGAVYAMRTAGFRAARHRFFGRVGLVEVPQADAIEIDTAADLDLATRLAVSRAVRGPVPVRALVTDFDGVHTDDRAILLQDGTEAVVVSRSDGAGVAALRAAGVPVMILSVEVNPVVAARARKLGVEVAHGVADKAERLLTWLDEHGLDPAEVAFVGNDLRDIGCMRLVGWPVAVADARPEVLAVARVVLESNGGAGAVREIADLILAAPLAQGSTRT
ncbi:acylneuraminate cytidylyltransferase [Actinokineospora sp. NBRC 105648]|uniref:acylneuraminate cytidylyltransferase n=1 Tax=Actinokineospora sp. NBRC 105648 TaxID=3032206 RepID=UPI0025539858|nr:acylneuraminate cytidylyltransferase [Actinokineospora sp. NBRC 105648]